MRTVLPTALDEALAWQQGKIALLFPEDAQVLGALCRLNDTFEYPLGYWHLDLLAELAGATPDPSLESLAAAYTLLVAYYFLLDSFADGHCRDQSDIVYLTHLLSGAWYYFGQSFLIHSHTNWSYAQSLINDCISRNAKAMIAEVWLRNSHSSNPSLDRECDINRSNPLLLLYQLICLLQDHTPAAEVLGSLSDYIVVQQRLDDLGDWRIDCRRGHRTPLLRRLQESSSNAITEEDIETILYIKGGYERELSSIRCELTHLLSAFRCSHPHGSRLADAIENQLRSVDGILDEWKDVKLSFLSSQQ
jgi:hypothetical protein